MKYILMFMKDIVQMFQARVDNPRSNKKPSAMLQELKRRYLGGYSIPGEEQNTTAFSCLYKKQKKGKELL